MTDLEKENVYGVAWIIYNAYNGIPDTSPSMFQIAPKVRHGTIEDIENYLESTFFDPVLDDGRQIIDPSRGSRWMALKVSKEGKSVYGDYSVPLCAWKLSERWDEKMLLMARAYQISVLMLDKRYDCVKDGVIDKVPDETRKKLKAELSALNCRFTEIVKKLADLGIGISEQEDFNRKYSM